MDVYLYVLRNSYSRLIAFYHPNLTVIKQHQALPSAHDTCEVRMMYRQINLLDMNYLIQSTQYINYL